MAISITDNTNGSGVGRWGPRDTDVHPYGPSIDEMARLRQQITLAPHVGAIDMVGAMSALQGTRKGTSNMRVHTIQNGYLVQFGNPAGYDQLDTAIFAATPTELAEKIAVYLTTQAMTAL